MTQTVALGCEFVIFIMLPLILFLPGIRSIQFRNWNCLFAKKMELDLINLELKLKFATKTLNPQINLSFNFLIQKYFFRDNPTWNINYSKYVFQVGTQSIYSW